MTRAARIGFAIGAMLLVMLPSELTRACVMVFPRFKVLPNFDVTVRVPAGERLDGIRVSIDQLDHKSEPPEPTVAEALTDKDRRAAFRGLKPVHGLLLVERGEITGDAVELDIVESNGLSALQLKWPDNKIFTAQRIAGTLLRAGIPGAPRNMDEDKTLANVELILNEASSGREVARTSTDDQGNFAFADVAPGFYAMHMKWHGTPDYVLLAVDTKAHDAGPSRYFISPTDCGLGASKEE